MQENFLSAGTLPRTPVRELSALPSWWGGGWLHLSKDLTPAHSPLARNMRLGPSHHDGLDPPMAFVPGQ